MCWILYLFFHLFVKFDTLQNAPTLLYVICTWRTILFYILYTTKNYFKALFLEAFISRPDMWFKKMSHCVHVSD